MTRFSGYARFEVPSSNRWDQNPLERQPPDQPLIASMNPDADDTFDFTIYVGEEEEEEV